MKFLGAHPTSIVYPGAKLGEGVQVGPFSIVHASAHIGDRTVIGSHCEIGYPTPLAEGAPLIVGEDSLIRSHSALYQGSQLGDRLTTGHRVTIREKTMAGVNLQVGTQNEIQGDCSIGDYVRFHSNVHVGQKSRIGSFVWIFPSSLLTNDVHPPSNSLVGVTVEDFAVLGAMCVFMAGVTVGRGALVAAHSSVNRDVEPDSLVAGSPAKFICPTTRIPLTDGTRKPAYPWRRHFHRGYPDDVVTQWLEEFPDR